MLQLLICKSKTKYIKCIETHQTNYIIRDWQPMIGQD